MKLSPIILALRIAKTHFGDLIGGGIDLTRVQQNTLTADTAFVIPLGEDATENAVDNSVDQTIRDRFAVVCAIKNDSSPKDKAGLLAYDVLDSIRAELFAVLINFDIGYASTIEYSGAKLLDINGAWLWWQYEFVVREQLAASVDGVGFVEERSVDDRQQVSQLPDINKIYADIILSPSANLPYSGTLPAKDFISVDASTQVTTDDDPNPGSFAASFTQAFRVLMQNIIRR